jgi:EAL domain-containing protein (putative c-di-GMP-specific phosphodiesterase class I)
MEPAFQAVFNMQGIDLGDESKFADGGALNAFRSQIFGFESLIRIRANAFDRRFWPDPVSFFEGRTLQPDVLFALAHHAHLALELDQACLKHALRAGAGLPGALMVNILPRNLYHVEAIKELIPGREKVVLEVSESEEIGNFDKLGEVCASLRSRHFKIAADDFGKGFAGLDRILKMRPDIIKIDRTLISHIDRDQARQTLLKSLVLAAKVAGAMVLAEGIERVEEARFCQANGVDLAQGYFFHKPQFRSDLERILASATEGESETGEARNGKISGVA